MGPPPSLPPSHFEYTGLLWGDSGWGKGKGKGYAPALGRHRNEVPLPELEATKGGRDAVLPEYRQPAHRLHRLGVARLPHETSAGPVGENLRVSRKLRILWEKLGVSRKLRWVLWEKLWGESQATDPEEKLGGEWLAFADGRRKEKVRASGEHSK